MKRLLRDIRDKLRGMRIGKNTLTFLIEVLVAVGLFSLLQFVFKPTGPLSMFPGAILLMMMGVGVLMYLTRMHMGGYTLKKALEENNIAYAIIVFAFSIIIATAISIV